MRDGIEKDINDFLLQCLNVLNEIIVSVKVKMFAFFFK